MPDPFPLWTTAEIVARRPLRNRVDSDRPYAFLSEPEINEAGQVVDVATLFLTNRECPFHCLMCDLWKNTLTETVPPGAIPAQIRWGLEQLPPARVIKLYNSGNFFDRKAIPAADYPIIADLVRTFEAVIVENHPRLCGPAVLDFRDRIAPARLEVALGLETIHPDVLASLNKEMTLDDFDRAIEFLHQHEIRTRAFLLLNPPFLSPEESLDWSVRSLEHCFARGVSACSVIATREGNGIMEELRARGEFTLPAGKAIESILQTGLQMQRGRVFVDLWDVEQFFLCDVCRTSRLERLKRMNLSQRVEADIECPECGA